MAEKSYHKTAEERVRSIEEHLKNLQTASAFLIWLANYKTDCEHRTAIMSVDNLSSFGCIMNMAVDTISAELGMLKYKGKPHAEAYVRKPQAAPEGGAA